MHHLKKMLKQLLQNCKKIQIDEKTIKTYLVDEKDLETIDYDDTQEDLFKGESIINAVNKVFDFEKFKKDQAEAINNTKKLLSKQIKQQII